MSDVGIRLSMEETVSSVAPKVSEALRSIGEAGKQLRDSLDLTGLEDEYKQFADRLDKIYDAQQKQRGPGQQMVQQLGGAVPGMLRAGGGVAQRLGQTGDVVGAGADVLGALGGVIKSMGPLGVLVSSLGAVGLGLNALEMQYEKQIPELMDLTAILDRFGDTSKETSANFKKVMDEVSGKASKFGYSLEYGINVTKSLAQISGVEGTRAIRGAGKVMEFGRGYGVSPEALSRYMGLGLRFGQGERVFERATGGLEAAGMGKGLFQEYLSSTLDIFEQGLSRGIIKGFDEINLAQTWLAKIGDVFKGQYGLQVYRQIEQSIAGATSLASEGDVLIYRATKRFLEKDRPRDTFPIRCT
ncbi:MAG: hypothetical protein FVQ80_13925 [Planctomycetes bacterium]|nr:hypothetical protein [Planctomycetota bacterium]